MSWFTSHIVDPVADLLGDVEKGISQVTHTGIAGDVRGWLGDVEHGLSQLSHSRGLRTAATDASIAAAAVLAPEFLGSTGAFSGGADAASGAAAADSLGGQAAFDASASFAPEAASLGGQAAFDASMSDFSAPFETSVAPPYFASTGDPLASTGGAIPGDEYGGPYNSLDPESGGFTPQGDFVPPDPSSTSVLPATDSWRAWLTSPRGIMSTLGLGASAYSFLHKPSLPDAAKQAYGVSAQAVKQAQTVIASGGMGTPLWNTQKQAIDAQIDQQISNMTRAIQQNAQNSGMGGSNSAAVQAMISDATGRLNAQRQQMYDQVLQNNVQNAVAELTGGNQTLMSIAQLQWQEDQYAQQLAASIANSTSKLYSVLPGPG